MKPLLDLPISSLGYGCYALSGAYGSQLEESEMIKILKYAYGLGIRFYDTASNYTGTEEILGKVIKSFRHNVTISSKIGITKENKINLSKEFVKSSCESSLKKLKTDYIDIYQVHYHDPNTPITETIEALESLKKEGKIRYYGIGHLPLDKTIEYLDLGNISFILAEMSPLSTYRYKELHPLQEKYDFNIICFSITGRGMLSGRINANTQFLSTDIRSIDPLFNGARLNSGIKMAEKLREIGNRYNKTPAQVAISWTIQNKGVIVGLTGPTKIEYLYENSQVLDWSLDKTSIEEINSFIKEEEKDLRKIIQEELNSILKFSISSDYEKLYRDLIYLIEYCIENQMISYENGINMYMKIQSVKNSGNNLLDRFNEIKNEIKSIISLKDNI